MPDEPSVLLSYFLSVSEQQVQATMDPEHPPINVFYFFFSILIPLVTLIVSIGICVHKVKG